MTSPTVVSLEQEQEIGHYVRALCVRACAAAPALARAATGAKNAALMRAAALLRAEAPALLAANQKDLDQARGLAAALVDRLTLNAERIEAMAAGLEAVAALPDPVGEVTDMRAQPSGIEVGRMRVPLGVIAIIYEARPNVTADAAALCLKSGNVSVLRGGSESVHSNAAIGRLLRRALADSGLPTEAIQVLERTERTGVDALLAMRGLVDVVIPRGGKGLVELVMNKAQVPVIKHLHGNCHVYVDDGADMAKALRIAVNAKTQRYGTCNTMETLLVAHGIAEHLLPVLAAEYRKHGVELRGCAHTRAIVPDAIAATEEDWETEYLAPILAVRVVSGLDEAIRHIGQYGSHHTDAIVTEDLSHARRFLREVDSSSVMVNASTRLADGFEYGLGAEIGISTDKLHARGPVGLEGLTSQKFVVFGDGHVRG